jgi:hypothetical protein
VKEADLPNPCQENWQRQEHWLCCQQSVDDLIELATILDSGKLDLGQTQGSSCCSSASTGIRQKSVPWLFTLEKPKARGAAEQP